MARCRTRGRRRCRCTPRAARASPPSAGEAHAPCGAARRGGDACSRSPASSGSGSVSTPGFSSRPGSRRPLRRGEGGDRLRRVHARQQLAAGAAVAVLARQRPAERHHQVGGLLGDPAQRRRRRPAAAGRSAAGCAGSRRSRGRTRRPSMPSRVQDPRGPRARSSGRRSGGTAGSSMNGERLRVARARRPLAAGARPMPARRTAHTARLAGGVEHHPRAGRAPRRRRLDLVRLAAVLHQQLGLGVGVERGGAHQLDGRRPGLQRPQRRLERGVHRVERHQRQPARRRARHQPQLGPADHGERPLRAADQPRPVRAPARRARRARSRTRAAAAPAGRKPSASGRAASRAGGRRRRRGAASPASRRRGSRRATGRGRRSGRRRSSGRPRSCWRSSRRASPGSPRRRRARTAARARRRRAFRSSSTTPGPTRAVRASGSIAIAAQRGGVDHEPGAHGLARPGWCRRPAS